MYVVNEYTPGYLPDSEGYDAEDWEGAMTIVEDIERQLEELGYKWVFSTTAQPYYSSEWTDPERMHDLGRVVVVEWCEGP